VFAPAYYAFGDGLAWHREGTILLCICVMTMLLINRHAENMARLVRGTESRLGKTQPKA
jgi:glycerol-3-phosphate acyltransferase PlsY